MAEFLHDANASGVSPNEIGVFVRTRAQLQRARDAIKSASLTPLEAADQLKASGVLVSTMHLAKGLEFKAVVVMACDQEVIPDFERISAAADEAELDEVYDTERQLFYVACTRARDRLLITGVAPVSEFLDDLRSK